MIHSITQLPLFYYPRICRTCGVECDPDDFVKIGQKSGRCSKCRIERKRYKLCEINYRSNARIKALVMDVYGGVCAYCGEDDIARLQIDHVAGNGKAHRAYLKTQGMALGAGPQLYYWLRKNDYPPGFQVLCGPCNWAKSNMPDRQFRQWVARVYRHMTRRAVMKVADQLHLL